jgi:hypothetical protein
MPSKVIFRCEFCDAGPSGPAQENLERRLRELAFGEYVDVQPDAIRNGALSPMPKWGRW